VHNCYFSGELDRADPTHRRRPDSDRHPQRPPVTSPPSLPTAKETPVNPRYDFTGQVALVTGASSGMGLATAQAFAQAGAAVVLADINAGALRAVTDDLTAAGHQALGVTCDVASEDEVAAMVDS